MLGGIVAARVHSSTRGLCARPRTEADRELEEHLVEGALAIARSLDGSLGGAQRIVRRTRSRAAAVWTAMAAHVAIKGGLHVPRHPKDGVGD